MDLLCAYRIDLGMKPHGPIHLIDVDPMAATLGDNDLTLCRRETVPDDPIHGWETCPDSMPPEGLERCEGCEESRKRRASQAHGHTVHAAIEEAGDMEKTDGLGASPPAGLCVCGHPVEDHDVAGCPSCSCPNPVPKRRQQGEVYAETDPEHWPDGRPTFGAGR